MFFEIFSYLKTLHLKYINNNSHTYHSRFYLKLFQSASRIDPFFRHGDKVRIAFIWPV